MALSSRPYSFWVASVSCERSTAAGVSVSGLYDGPPPELLFDDGDRQRGHTLEQLSAKVAAKFEGSSLTRAALLEKPRNNTGNADTTRSPKRPPKL